MASRIEQALAVLAEAAPGAIDESLTRLERVNPDAAIRAELALRVLAATEDRDVEFFATVRGGYQGGQP